MPEINSTPSGRSDPPTKPLQIAYVRKMCEYEEEFYGIYDEHGSALAIAPSRELAFITIRQHDLVPVDVH